MGSRSGTGLGAGAQGDLSAQGGLHIPVRYMVAVILLSGIAECVQRSYARRAYVSIGGRNVRG